ncbi:MAG: hypothetical protein V4576_00035 [Patescibacteria group bacterium]
MKFPKIRFDYSFKGWFAYWILILLVITLVSGIVTEHYSAVRKAADLEAITYHNRLMLDRYNQLIRAENKNVPANDYLSLSDRIMTDSETARILRKSQEFWLGDLCLWAVPLGYLLYLMRPRRRLRLGS